MRGGAALLTQPQRSKRQTTTWWTASQSPTSLELADEILITHAHQRHFDINQKLWNAKTAVHKDSAFYDLAGIRAGKTSRNPPELELVGEVAGKSLLHLQCHFRLDTLSWSRLGTRVTEFHEISFAGR